MIGWGILFVLWWIPSSDSSVLVTSAVGLFATATVVVLFHRFELRVDIPLSGLIKPWLWLKFFSYLLWRVGLSTVRTCYLILTGDLDQKIFIYESNLKNRTGLLLLLNSITLTPTSIAILHEDDLIYVHHLSIRDKKDYETLIEEIERNLENPLAALLDRPE